MSRTAKEFEVQCPSLKWTDVKGDTHWMYSGRNYFWFEEEDGTKVFLHRSDANKLREIADLLDPV